MLLGSIPYLAPVPYLVAAVLYYASASELFRDESGKAPRNWHVRLFLPMLAGSLTPLAVLAAEEGISGLGRLLLGAESCAGVVFGIVVAGLCWGPNGYFALQVPVSWRGGYWKKLPRWRAVVIVGIAILVFGAGVNTFVGTAKGQAETPKVLSR